MSATGEGASVDRLRKLAERVIARVGGVPAVRTLLATLDVFDRAGGGLVAGGLAYSALVALLPGLLLIVSVVGIIVDDAVTRADVVARIAAAFPPLETLAGQALDQFAAGAVPTGIIAGLWLLWGASRFYSALDNAFARIFLDAPRRNELQRAIRGLILTAIFVVLPVAVLLASSIAAWLIDHAPAAFDAGSALGGVLSLASPLGSVILFVGGTVLAYRFIPAHQVPLRACGMPALVAGLSLAAFNQVFAFIAPRLVGIGALYGTFAAIFALLAWLAIGFNVLMLGASWTRVRLGGPVETPSGEAPSGGTAAKG